MLRFLLDTNILIRWLTDPGKLSKAQTKVLDELDRRGQPFGISAITLLEIALLNGDLNNPITGIDELYQLIEDSPLCKILPLTIEVAMELAAVGSSLRDPADRTIVATARVHRLKLVTADQRIIDSRLVTVVE